VVDDHDRGRRCRAAPNSTACSRALGAGIGVRSMRNKANRLEELFVALLESHKERRMSTAVRWVPFKTIVVKEVNRILRIWGQTLVPPAITMTLYFLIFGSWSAAASARWAAIATWISSCPAWS
jgi:hypothetical protein